MNFSKKQLTKTKLLCSLLIGAGFGMLNCKQTSKDIYEWDVSEKCIYKDKEDIILASAFSPDGKQFAYFSLNNNGEFFLTVNRNRTKVDFGIKDLFFSPNGQRLACIGKVETIFNLSITPEQ